MSSTSPSSRRGTATSRSRARRCSSSPSAAARPIARSRATPQRGTRARRARRSRRRLARGGEPSQALRRDAGARHHREGSRPRDGTRAGPFLAYDASSKTAWLRIDAAGMSFDGRAGGTGVVVIPLGWRVEARLPQWRRRAALRAHRRREAFPFPLVPRPLRFTGAQTKSPEAGILSGDGDRFQVAPLSSRPAERARREALVSTVIACAVPGVHAERAEWLNGH